MEIEDLATAQRVEVQLHFLRRRLALFSFGQPERRLTWLMRLPLIQQALTVIPPLRRTGPPCVYCGQRSGAVELREGVRLHLHRCWAAWNQIQRRHAARLVAVTQP